MTEASSNFFPLIAVAVAVDKDKSSQGAFKWALENVVTKGQNLIIIHVNTKAAPSATGQKEDAVKELLLPFRIFCKRKDINCEVIVLEDADVAKAVIEFVSQSSIEKLVIGSSRSGFVRAFRSTDLCTNISKSVPDYCTVYIINKGKVSSVRNAIRPAPAVSSLRALLQSQASPAPAALTDHQNLEGKRGDAAFETRNLRQESSLLPGAASFENHSPNLYMERSGVSPFETRNPKLVRERVEASPFQIRNLNRYKEGPVLAADAAPETPNVYKDEPFRSPFNRRPTAQLTRYSEDSMSGSDTSPVSSGGASFYAHRLREINGLDSGFDSMYSPDMYSAATGCSSQSISSQISDTEMEAEMYRLRFELKHKMDMYSTYKEAFTAKQKLLEFEQWKKDREQRRIQEEARLIAEEAAKLKAAPAVSEAAKRLAQLEAQQRKNAEMKALQESDQEATKAALMDYYSLHKEVGYREYTIKEIEEATDYFSDRRKIGEGGYGPVYSCYLDHTPVAVKVLRCDAAQGMSQFQQEVEILSCIRHPHMVLLLGACPEHGCLVYEYMANGSLQDRLCQRGNTAPIPWQHRFRIAAEIATGLLFLHQTKPEPLVHRDLKPDNILLDQNYVSKISDVGLARLLPPSAADNVTQYRMTCAAGTLCYIDPEYQKTGMLSVKSDVYSLGVILLQLITGRSPMGLAMHVERCIDKGTFPEILDPSVEDWPVEEALSLAKLALNCTELKRTCRPDLATVVLPELNRLRAIWQQNIQNFDAGGNNFLTSTTPTQVSLHDMKSGPLNLQGYESP